MIALAALLQGLDAVAIDPRITVAHVQSTGRLGTFVNHFHAGRSLAGFGREFVPRGTRLRWLGRNLIMVPSGVIRRARRAGGASDSSPGTLVLNVALAITGTVGFAWGALTGPGQSALRLR